MPRINVNPNLSIDEDEVLLSFVRSSGPGGQNVNKVSSAVELRFDAANSPSLPGDVKRRLRALAGSRMTRDGVLTIDARRHRTQTQNRQDALERLVDLLARAATAPRPRRKTRPTAGARRRRLEHKKHRSATKSLRTEITDE